MTAIRPPAPATELGWPTAERSSSGFPGFRVFSFDWILLDKMGSPHLTNMAVTVIRSRQTDEQHDDDLSRKI